VLDQHNGVVVGLESCQDYDTCAAAKRSTPFYKQTHASKSKMSRRKKPRVLLEPTSTGAIHPVLNFQVPPQDHINPEPSIWVPNSVGATHLFRGINLNDEDPLRRLLLSLNDRSTTQSPQISESVMSHNLPPRSRCCTTQAVVATLQLSGWLRIRTNSSAYQFNQPRRDQNCHKICIYVVQTTADSSKSHCSS